MNWDRFWWVALLLGCLGDVVTTWYGITVLGLVEKNPIAATIMNHAGVLGAIVLIKVLFILFALVMYDMVSRYKWVVPAGPAVINIGVTVVNLYAIHLAT